MRDVLVSMGRFHSVFHNTSSHTVCLLCANDVCYCMSDSFPVTCLSLKGSHASQSAAHFKCIDVHQSSEAIVVSRFPLGIRGVLMSHMEHDVSISDHHTEAIVTIKHLLASFTCRLLHGFIPVSHM